MKKIPTDIVNEVTPAFARCQKCGVLIGGSYKKFDHYVGEGQGRETVYEICLRYEQRAETVDKIGQVCCGCYKELKGRKVQ